MKTLIKIGIACVILAAVGLQLSTQSHAAAAPAAAPATGRVFELRTYTANPGKFDAMKTRFQQSILALFKKHNMEVVGFWTPTDAPNSSNTLIYILAHPSRAAADKNWQAFKDDPEKIRVWAETEKDGVINLKVESVYMTALPWSAIK